MPLSFSFCWSHLKLFYTERVGESRGEFDLQHGQPVHHSDEWQPCPRFDPGPRGEWSEADLQGHVPHTLTVPAAALCDPERLARHRDYIVC